VAVNYGWEVSVVVRLSHAEKQALGNYPRLNAVAGDGYQANEIIYRESSAKGASLAG
jgi:hypothetical protein